ncbi:MAG TPA: DUF2924 domain-containing protein [Urbifossiella sp.]|jgi:hypothetical protein
MGINVGKEVAALERMTVKQLRERFAAVFGEATTAHNKPWLVKRIAWRLQANAEGGLSELAQARAAELARDSDLRLSPPPKAEAAPGRIVAGTVAAEVDRRLPPPGTIITRKYKGGTVQVKVLPDGFEYAGESYVSLSAVAKAITGSHCNGFLFFRLTGKGGAA